MDDLFRNQLHKKDGSNASTTTLRPRLHNVPGLTNKYLDFRLIKSKGTKNDTNQNDCQFSAPPPQPVPIYVNNRLQTRHTGWVKPSCGVLFKSYSSLKSYIST